MLSQKWVFTSGVSLLMWWCTVVCPWWQYQLFNGDFVDRGSFSVECIFTLLSFKMLYPSHFFMSRGTFIIHVDHWCICCWFIDSHSLTARPWLFGCDCIVCQWQLPLTMMSGNCCCRKPWEWNNESDVWLWRRSQIKVSWCLICFCVWQKLVSILL